MLDYGTGPGTSIWAAKSVWDDAIEHVTAVDVSESMLRTAEDLMTDAAGKPVFNNVRFMRFLPQPKPGSLANLVTASYVLNEQPDRALKMSLVQTLWSHTADVLVLIEPGTPLGNLDILMVRDMIRTGQLGDAHIIAPVRVIYLEFLC